MRPATTQNVENSTAAAGVQGRHGWFVVGGPCCLYLAIALPLINRATFFRDELATREFSQLSLTDLLRATSHVDRVFTPYYLLMHFWGLLGSGPVMMRAPSVAAGVITVGVVARTAYGLWGWPAGLVAGTTLALDGSFVDMTLVARPYAISIMLCAVATLLLSHALHAEDTGARIWLAYGVVVSLAVVMQIFAVLIVVSHLVPVVIARRSAPLRRFGSAIVAPVVLAGAILAATHQQSGQVAWVVQPDPRIAFQVFRGLTGETGHAVVLFLAVAVSAAVRLRSARLDGFWLMALAMVVVPIVALYAASLVASPVLVDRYTVTVQIATALLLGAAAEPAAKLVTALARGGEARWLPAATAVSLVVAVTAVSVVGLRAEARLRYRNDNWTALTGFLATTTHRGDVVVVAQPYDEGGFAVGEPYYAGDQAFSAAVVAGLPSGAPTLYVRDVVGTVPLRTGADPGSRLAARTWLVELGDNDFSPDGYAGLAARGCRPADRTVEASTTVISDIDVVRLRC